jgi:hypothetical protein
MMNALSIERDSDDEKDRNRDDSEDEADGLVSDNDAMKSVIAATSNNFDESSDEKKMYHSLCFLNSANLFSIL